MHLKNWTVQWTSHIVKSFKSGTHITLEMDAICLICWFQIKYHYFNKFKPNLPSLTLDWIILTLLFYPFSYLNILTPSFIICFGLAGIFVHGVRYLVLFVFLMCLFLIKPKPTFLSSPVPKLLIAQAGSTGEKEPTWRGDRKIGRI